MPLLPLAVAMMSAVFRSLRFVHLRPRPPCNRMRPDSTSPCCAAKGEAETALGAGMMSAPRSSSNCTSVGDLLACPTSAAAVGFFAFTSAPRSSRVLAASRWPLSTAAMSGVSPERSGARFAVPSKSRLINATCPFALATKRAVAPYSFAR